MTLGITVPTMPAAYIAARAAGDAAHNESGSTRALSNGKCANTRRIPGG